MAKKYARKKPNPNMARPGNNHNATLKTFELKQMAYKQYCKHIADGLVKKSWYFDHPELKLTWNSMERYIAEDSDLDPQEKEIAFSKGYQKWEKVVGDSAAGDNKNANTATLQMLMRNKYGWDKDSYGQKDSNEPLLKKMARRWREKDD